MSRPTDIFSRILVATLLCLCTMVATVANAQDYSFSNHNIVPFSLNPSLAGNANNVRFGLNYRQQWPMLGNKYHTFRASYDQNFFKRKCCLGFSYAMDNYAGGIYVTNELSGTYSHCFQLREGVYLRLGVQLACFINHFGYEKLTFEDQFDLGTFNVVPTTTEDFDHVENRKFVDFNFGAAINLENKLTVGAAIFHISQPDNGFVNTQDNQLNRKFVAHINYIKDLESGNGLFSRRALSQTYVFVNGTYQHQGEWNQAYLGAGVFLTPVIAGVSFKHDLDEISNVSFMVGASIQAVQIYYIYDLFTSRKKNGSWSHEISAIYVFRTRDRYPCPVVYW